MKGEYRIKDTVPCEETIKVREASVRGSPLRIVFLVDGVYNCVDHGNWTESFVEAEIFLSSTPLLPPLSPENQNTSERNFHSMRKKKCKEKTNQT